jgi:hypothetical protein
MNGVSWCLLACVVVAVRRLFIVYFNIYIPFIIHGKLSIHVSFISLKHSILFLTVVTSAMNFCVYLWYE